MPLYLKARDVTADLENVKSVLIVSCPICPPMSLAMQKKKPFIEFFKHGLKTPAFQDYVNSIRGPLEQRGVRTDACTMRMPSPMMCAWTEGQHNRLRKRAKDYEAVLVLGCDSATRTVEDALKGTDCQVFEGMRMTAVTNATMTLRFPGTVELKRNAVPEKHKAHRHEAAADATEDIETAAP